MVNIPAGIFSSGLISNNMTKHRDLISEAIAGTRVDLMDSDGGVAINSISETGLQVVDGGGGTVNVKAGAAYDKFGQRIYLATDDSASGIYTSTVSITTIDLSTNYNIKIDIDNAGAVEIDCRGAMPASTTIQEIVDNINAAGFGTIAYRGDSGGNPDTTGSYITIKSQTTGSGSEVEFVAPSANDATNEIFGLSEAAYPHTYNGGGGYSIPESGGATTYNVIIEHLAVEKVIGTFASGYPSGDDSKYTERHDSYKITITTSSPVSDSNQHELLLAEATNNSGTLTITDKRGNILLRLTGVKQVDTSPPSAPTKVSLTTGTRKIQRGKLRPPAVIGWIKVKWDAVSDVSGIRGYIISLYLEEEEGDVKSVSEYSEVQILNFDKTASEIEHRIDLPLGNKYNVQVAAMDASLNQNVSDFTDFGDITVGTGDTIEMTSITLDPFNGGVLVDWPDIDGAIFYEYVYSTDNSTPQFITEKIEETRKSEFRVRAEPGILVKVRVRAVDGALQRTDDVSGETYAGGVSLGDNEKQLDLQKVSVLATEEGKADRKLGILRLPKAATIVELAVNVQSLALNDSVVGLVRIYRIDAEADAGEITFKVTGQTEVTLDMDVDKGWIVVDAYDENESGTNQAAFTVDVYVTYVEAKIKTAKTTGTTTKSTNL